MGGRQSRVEPSVFFLWIRCQAANVWGAWWGMDPDGRWFPLMCPWWNETHSEQLNLLRSRTSHSKANGRRGVKDNRDAPTCWWIYGNLGVQIALRSDTFRHFLSRSNIYSCLWCAALGGLRTNSCCQHRSFALQPNPVKGCICHACIMYIVGTFLFFIWSKSDSRHPGGSNLNSLNQNQTLSPPQKKAPRIVAISKLAGCTMVPSRDARTRLHSVGMVDPCCMLWGPLGWYPMYPMQESYVSSLVLLCGKIPSRWDEDRWSTFNPSTVFKQCRALDSRWFEPKSLTHDNACNFM